MKILFTLDDIYIPPGGAQRAVSCLANEMSLRGQDVSIIISREIKSKKQTPFFHLDKKIKIASFVLQCKATAVLKKNNFKNIIKKAFMYKKLLQKFFPHVVIDFMKYCIYNFLHFLFLDKLLWHKANNIHVYQIEEYLKKHQPDIVIASLPETFILFYLACKKRAVPLVIYHHNNPQAEYTFRHYPNKYELSLCKKAIAEANANIVLDELFIKYFPKKIQDKTIVIPNAVAFKATVKDYKKNLKNNFQTIISVGRLVENKNHQLLIKAFLLLKDKHKNWQVKIYGSGNYEKQLEKIINKYNLTDRVFLMGSLPNVFQEYLNSDICAFPSKYEGFGLGLAEAMFVGLPAVVLEKCIPPSKFIQESAGGFVSKSNHFDYAAKLDLLMSDNSLRLSMGQNARKYAKRFDQKNIYDKWEMFFKKFATETNI